MKSLFKMTERHLLPDRRFVVTALLVAAFIMCGFFMRLDYYLIVPSRAVELGDLISVESGDADDLGSFYLVTVSQQRASPFTAFYALVHPGIDINPLTAVIPRGMSEEEYRRLMAEHMAESRQMAQVVALRRAGYQIEVASEGIEVVGFLESAPAGPYLQKNDILLAVDGTAVVLASEVPLIVKERKVGDTVHLSLLRDGNYLEVDVPTAEHPEEEGMPFLGIYIKTLPWQAAIPITIVMDTGRIGGSSAGMMFTLEILNQVMEEDLTAGKRIAGTGTIDFNENIGRIGGITQKVIAAERAGAELFLAPEANYEEAKEAASWINVIPVSNLSEVLEVLRSLGDNE